MKIKKMLPAIVRLGPIAMFLLAVPGCGEKYNEQGGALGKAYIAMLIERGYCTSPHSCFQILETYFSHGNKVNFTIYAPKNQAALNDLMNYVITNGLQITGNVPISIEVYPKPRVDYGDNLFPPPPSILLEVNPQND